MSTTIEKIRGLLNLPQLRRFYAEGRLDDGRLVVTEAESMAVGVEVFIMNEEGQSEALPDGEYLLEDGTALTIAEGRIAQLGEEAPAEVEASEEQQTAPGDFAAAIAAIGLTPEHMEAVMAAAQTHFGQVPAAEPAQDSGVVEAMAEQVAEAFRALDARLQRLEEAPAEPGVQHSPKARKENMSAAPTQYADPVMRAFQTMRTIQA